MHDDIMKIIMAIPDRPPMGEEDPMAPGHHGPVSGPSEADELLCQIKCMICEYLEGKDIPEKPAEAGEGEEAPEPDKED